MTTKLKQNLIIILITPILFRGDIFYLKFQWFFIFYICLCVKLHHNKQIIGVYFKETCYYFRHDLKSDSLIEF